MPAGARAAKADCFYLAQPCMVIMCYLVLSCGFGVRPAACFARRMSAGSEGALVGLCGLSRHRSVRRSQGAWERKPRTHKTGRIVVSGKELCAFLKRSPSGRTATSTRLSSIPRVCSTRLTSGRLSPASAGCRRSGPPKSTSSIAHATWFRSGFRLRCCRNISRRRRVLWPTAAW